MRSGDIADVGVSCGNGEWASRPEQAVEKDVAREIRGVRDVESFREGAVEERWVDLGQSICMNIY